MAENKIKAPYASVANFSKMFKNIKTLKFNSITPEILEKYGLRGFKSTTVIATLKFLGIIDKNGNVTDKYKWLKYEGEKYKENIRKMVKEAYSSLFGRLGQNLTKVSKVDIENAIHEVYCLDSKQMQRSTTALFIFLCKEAEIELPPDLKAVPSKEQKPKTKEKEKIPKTKLKEDMLNKIAITLNLSKGMTEDDIYSLLKNLESAMERFEKE